MLTKSLRGPGDDIFNYRRRTVRRLREAVGQSFKPADPVLRTTQRGHVALWVRMRWTRLPSRPSVANRVQGVADVAAPC